MAESPSRGTYTEGRFFKNGKQWLGYLEGRPGVIMPALTGSHSGRVPTRRTKRGKRAVTVDVVPRLSLAKRADARRRIADSAPVQAQPTAKARRRLAAQLFRAWEVTERYGAFMQMVVDNDSTLERDE